MVTTGTNEEVTVEGLEARLAEQQRAVDEAERAIGAAELDGTGGQRASKTLGDAKEAARRTEAAIVELHKRREEQAESEAEAAVAARQRRSYAWAAAYFRTAAEVVEAFTALETAERALVEHTSARSGDGAIYALRTGVGRARFDPRVLDGLDRRIVGRIPRGPKGSWAARDGRYLIGTSKDSLRSAADYANLAELAEAAQRE